MNIGEPKRELEIQPVTLPVPERVPMPCTGAVRERSGARRGTAPSFRRSAVDATPPSRSNR